MYVKVGQHDLHRHTLFPLVKLGYPDPLNFLTYFSTILGLFIAKMSNYIILTYLTNIWHFMTVTDVSNIYVKLVISPWKMQKKNYHFSWIISLKMSFLMFLALWYIYFLICQSLQTIYFTTYTVFEKVFIIRGVTILIFLKVSV